MAVLPLAGKCLRRRMLWLFNALVMIAIGSVTACVHDQLDHRVVTQEQQYHPDHPFLVAERRRRLQTNGESKINPQDYLSDNVFAPIRLTPIYDNDSLSQLSDDKREMVNRMIPDAIQRFKQMLSVVPVQGNLFAKRSCYQQFQTTPIVCKNVMPQETCFEMPIPVEHFVPTRVCYDCLSTGCGNSNCSMLPGDGVANSDYVIYVRAVSTSTCNGQVLAYASACQKDQFDRPTFGMVNFCPDLIDSTPNKYENQLATAMHEMTHALGFSAQFYAFMRNKDGTPRTPRDANGKPPIQTSGKCANGNTITYFASPDPGTVQFSWERDHVIARVITPTVAQYVQDHFNCSTLAGAEIENQDSGCLGSHWEERIFEAEYMSPQSSFVNIISGLTLAFLEDTGWYKTNATITSRLHFGADKGCAFATSQCIDKGTQTPVASDHYCTANDFETCTVDATARASCQIGSGMTIPSLYQYFSDATRGGLSTFADYCPFYGGFLTGDCTNPNNRPLRNLMGETHCPSCRCTKSNLVLQSAGWAPSARRRSGCYAMTCTASGGVQISISTPTGPYVVNCTNPGDTLTVPGYSGSITCPLPVVVCEQKCPRACSGRGVCDFSTDLCTCNGGWAGDDCSKQVPLTTPPATSSPTPTSMPLDTPPPLPTAAASASPSPTPSTGPTATPLATAPAMPSTAPTATPLATPSTAPTASSSAAPPSAPAAATSTLRPISTPLWTQTAATVAPTVAPTTAPATPQPTSPMPSSTVTSPVGTTPTQAPSPSFPTSPLSTAPTNAPPASVPSTPTMPATVVSPTPTTTSSTPSSPSTPPPSPSIDSTVTPLAPTTASSQPAGSSTTRPISTSSPPPMTPTPPITGIPSSSPAPTEMPAPTRSPSDPLSDNRAPSTSTFSTSTPSSPPPTSTPPSTSMPTATPTSDGSVSASAPSSASLTPTSSSPAPSTIADTTAAPTSGTTTTTTTTAPVSEEGSDGSQADQNPSLSSSSSSSGSDSQQSDLSISSAGSSGIGSAFDVDSEIPIFHPKSVETGSNGTETTDITTPPPPSTPTPKHTPRAKHSPSRSPNPSPTPSPKPKISSPMHPPKPTQAKSPAATDTRGSGSTTHTTSTTTWNSPHSGSSSGLGGLVAQPAEANTTLADTSDDVCTARDAASNCSYTSDQMVLTTNPKGETYCPTCQCLRSSLSLPGSALVRPWGCYSVKCIAPNVAQLAVPLHNSVFLANCSSNMTELTVPGYLGAVLCAQPSRVCQGSCPRGCSSHGTCNTSTQVCTCDAGWGGVDCASATNRTLPPSSVPTTTPTTTATPPPTTNMTLRSASAPPQLRPSWLIAVALTTLGLM